MLELFTKSSIGCQSYQDVTSCQTLANLCVLSLYDELSAACEFFSKIVGSDTYKDQFANQDYSKNWKSKLPWLLYKEQTPTQLLKTPLETSKYNMKVGLYD